MRRVRRPGRLVAICAAGALGIGTIVAATQLPASAASAVMINGGTTYQTIDGFGISEGFGMADAIRNLDSTNRQKALDLLFNTSTGAGFSILRNWIPDAGTSIEPTSPGSATATPHYVWTGSDSQDQGQLWLSKQAKNTYGVNMFYNNAWKAPSYMITGGGLCGTPGASCSSGDWRQAYANYLVQHSKYWSQAGITPNYLGFVNESPYNMTANPAQAANFLPILGQTLAASGLSTKATCCDPVGFNQMQSYISAVEGNSAANSAVGLFTAHGYAGAPTTAYNTGGRHIWQSEWSINGNTWTNTWEGSGETPGILWAQRLYTGMTSANLNGFLYWWGIATTHHDSQLIGLTGSTMDINKRYYVMAQYSRYIRPGAVRIAATTGDSNLQVCAFRNTDGSVVVVALNLAQSDTATSFSGMSGNGTVAPYMTNGSSNMAAQSTIPLSNGAFSATVPARSMVTYRITGGGTPPPSSPPASPTPSRSTTPSSTPPSSTTPTSTPPSSTTPSSTPSSPSNPGSGCSATYTVTSSWPGGFQVDVSVRNNGSSPINGWAVKWTFASGQAVSSLWNGNLTASGNGVTVTNASYNGTIAGDGTATFGFTGTGSSTPVPSVTCTAS